MGDPAKFANAADYYLFNLALALLLLTELIIMFFTLRGRKSKTKTSSDSGTILLVFLAFYGSIFLSVLFRSSKITGTVKHWLLPYAFFYIGFAMIVLGIIVRVTAIAALRHSFTLSVQTTEEQSLIQNGLYRFVRNPAYTGSIISLLGIAFAYRHILGAACVLILCLICYGIRIKVEERALENQFRQEFRDYCLHTKYRLFPGIY